MSLLKYQLSSIVKFILLSVNQPLIGLQNTRFSKCLSIIFVRLWTITNPAQLNSRSTAALAGKATFIRRKKGSFSCGKQQYLI